MLLIAPAVKGFNGVDFIATLLWVKRPVEWIWETWWLAVCLPYFETFSKDLHLFNV